MKKQDCVTHTRFNILNSFDKQMKDFSESQAYDKQYAAHFTFLWLRQCVVLAHYLISTKVSDVTKHKSVFCLAHFNLISSKVSY